MAGEASKRTGSRSWQYGYRLRRDGSPWPRRGKCGGQPSGFPARPIMGVHDWLTSFLFNLQRLSLTDRPRSFPVAHACHRGGRRRIDIGLSCQLCSPRMPVAAAAGGRSGCRVNWLHNCLGGGRGASEREGRRVSVYVLPTARAQQACSSPPPSPRAEACRMGCSNAAGHDIKRMWDGDILDGAHAWVI